MSLKDLQFQPGVSSLLSNKGFSLDSSIGLEKFKHELKRSNNSIPSPKDYETLIKGYSRQVVAEIDKKLKEDSLEVIFLLDKSKSCKGTEEDTMAGFNHFVQKYKSEGGLVYVTVSLFDTYEELIYNRTPIEQVRPFSYEGFGRTALYDTLKRRIEYIRDEQAKESINAPRHTICIIMTDGRDNESKECNSFSLNRLIEAQKKAGWEFILLGALNNQAEVQHYARALGIPTNNTQFYLPEHVATNFYAVEEAVDSLRHFGKINTNWAEAIKSKIQNQGIQNDGITDKGKQLSLEKKRC